MNRWHRAILAGIKIAVIVFLIWRVYQFLKATLLIRNAKRPTMDMSGNTGVLRGIIERAAAGPKAKQSKGSV